MLFRSCLDDRGRALLPPSWRVRQYLVITAVQGSRQCSSINGIIRTLRSLVWLGITFANPDSGSGTAIACNGSIFVERRVHPRLYIVIVVHCSVAPTCNRGTLEPAVLLWASYADDINSRKKCQVTIYIINFIIFLVVFFL